MYPAAHQLYQTTAQGKTKAGAAEAARDGRVCLGKRRKNAFLLFLAHADAFIAHQACEGNAIALAVQKLQIHAHQAAL